jgi:hypothetical protein
MGFKRQRKFLSSKEILLWLACAPVCSVLLPAMSNVFLAINGTGLFPLILFCAAISMSITAAGFYLLGFADVIFKQADYSRKFLAHVGISSAVLLPFVAVLPWFLPQFETVSAYAQAVFAVIGTAVLSVLINSTFLAVSFAREWRTNILQLEALKRDILNTQIESLRHQMSPHFFFNSLNSLTVVIEEDPVEAVKYVHHLAHMYRYLLQSKETKVVQLYHELKFAETYIYLQKMRFGKALYMSVHIDDAEKHTLIPPLTLYILLENALKHNIITKAKPLHITVYIQDGKLQISNNIQARSEPEEMANVGLNNVRISYESISLMPMQVTTSNDNFTVALPLIRTLSQSA